jgi:hypothetical protein
VERIMNTQSPPGVRRIAARHLRKAQDGVVLFIALIALVALSLAGLAFMRSVDTGGLIAGNLAFSRAAVAYTDIGMEQARSEMLNLAALNCGTDPCLYTTQPTPTAQPQKVFYSAKMDESWHYRNNARWDDTDSGVIASPVSGFQIRFIVHRLCKTTGPLATNSCVTDPTGSSVGGGISLGSIDYGSVLSQGAASAADPQPYYRVTIRVQGPRNSVVYTQAWVV